MVQKYTEFINESLNLILESDIVYSNQFRKVLTKIDSKVSKKLLDIENEDLPVRTNFFDVATDSNDKVSFIPDARAQQIIESKDKYYKFIGNNGGWLNHRKVNQRIFTALSYEYKEDEEPYHERFEIGKEVSRVTTKSDRTYVYIEFKNGGKAVFNINKLEEQDNKKEVWNKFRQEIKVGRATRALLQITKDEFTTKEIEDFVNLFKSIIDKSNGIFAQFDIVKGEEIAHWYSFRNYYKRRGNLGNSCMANVSDDYFDIYVKNPDVCNLVILRSKENEDKIMGRALLWTLNDGKKFMDRIYTVNDSDISLFKDYSMVNGWYYKRYNDSRASAEIMGKDRVMLSLDVLTVDITKGYYEGYPYLDTLKSFNPIEGTLSTKSSSKSFHLESTYGDLMCPECGGEGSTYCSMCDGEGYHDDDTRCTDCNGRGSITCSVCYGNGSLNAKSAAEYLASR